MKGISKTGCRGPVQKVKKNLPTPVIVTGSILRRSRGQTLLLDQSRFHPEGLKLWDTFNVSLGGRRKKNYSLSVWHDCDISLKGSNGEKSFRRCFIHSHFHLLLHHLNPVSHVRLLEKISRWRWSFWVPRTPEDENDHGKSGRQHKTLDLK